MEKGLRDVRLRTHLLEHCTFVVFLDRLTVTDEGEIGFYETDIIDLWS